MLVDSRPVLLLSLEAVGAWPGERTGDGDHGGMSGTSSDPVIGIIGGSGIYELEGLRNVRWRAVASPFGTPSDELCFGDLDGQELVFLPRHGRGHRVPPSEINYRANIDALKRVGVTDIISVGAVGSLREGLAPGMFVIVDQFIDRTFARAKSFFGTGLVAHVSMAHPVCRRLGDHVEEAARAAGITVERGGTYIVMEGPQFSTLAESNLYRGWGCDVIGMTAMPEAKLAREAEICYACVAMITDYDCWHPGHDHVTVDAVVKVLLENAARARSLVGQVAPRLGDHRGPCIHGCQNALDAALITAPQARDPEVLQRLDAVAGRVLGGHAAS
jgi:5'-methylthioadenosine phosphorylase